MAKKKSKKKEIEPESSVEAVSPKDLEVVEKKEVEKKDSKKKTGDQKLIPPKYRKFHK